MNSSLLVPISSACRVGESGTLLADPPFPIFYKDKVCLCPHPRFCSKVSSEFHLNQIIYLPIFFLKSHKSNVQTVLHTLDVRRVLSFCLHRIKPFHKSPRLLVRSICREIKRFCYFFPEAIKMDFWMYYNLLHCGQHSPLLACQLTQ